MTAEPDDTHNHHSGRSTLTDLVHWAPALLLLLYVLGYVVANSHYSRYQLVRADLLSARYLSAGLLWATFAGVPAIGGYVGGFSAGANWRLGHKSSAVMWCLAYLLGSAVVFLSLGLNTLVGKGSSGVWQSMVWIFAGVGIISLLWGILLGKFGNTIHLQSIPEKLFQLSGTAITLVWISYNFGTHVYPWVTPSYGGAAVREGLVTLKANAPENLKRALSSGPVPLLDLDDKFLYVIACSGSSGDHPDTILVPLELVASTAVPSSSKDFLVVPAYLQHRQCPPADAKT